MSNCQVCVDQSLTWSPAHQTLALLTAVVFIRVPLHICTRNIHKSFTIKLLMFVYWSADPHLPSSDCQLGGRHMYIKMHVYVCVLWPLTSVCSSWLDEGGQTPHGSSKLLFQSQQILCLLPTCQGEGLLLHHLEKNTPVKLVPECTAVVLSNIQPCKQLQVLQGTEVWAVAWMEGNCLLC